MKFDYIYIFEGPDAVGKSSLIADVKEHIEDEVTNVVTLDLPNPKDWRPASDDSLLASFEWFAHINDAIRSAALHLREEDINVLLMDRSWISTYVYQNAIETRLIANIIKSVTEEFCEHQLAICFMTPPSQGEAWIDRDTMLMFPEIYAYFGTKNLSDIEFVQEHKRRSLSRDGEWDRKRNIFLYYQYETALLNIEPWANVHRHHDIVNDTTNPIYTKGFNSMFGALNMHQLTVLGQVLQGDEDE